LILDSSVLVASERQGQNSRDMLGSLSQIEKRTEVGISVISRIELAHGIHRANTPAGRERRQMFLDEIVSVIPVYDVTPAVAMLAGRADAENQARGVRVPLADLLIGVTALSLGYGLATANVRHFASVSGLSVLKI
jgi:tRNA(fMet)-specific endonuclease VapC